MLPQTNITMATVMSSSRTSSRRKVGTTAPSVGCLIRCSLLLVASIWFIGLFWSLTSLFDDGKSASSTANKNNDNIVTFHLDLDPPVSFRMELFSNQTPKATEYIRNAIGPTNCTACSLYRGEPVPKFWGDPSLPDTWDGGRWGPPYALIQGQVISEKNVKKPPPPEEHRPEIEGGMVAWAGGGGGPHFFVALANHPEWKHSHTVFGRVLESDMQVLQDLLQRPLVTTKPKRPPPVTNFVTPIPFTLE